MKQCEKIAYDYLVSKYGNEVQFKDRIFYVGNEKFRAKRIYGKTVWLYPHELYELKSNNINLLAVTDDGKIHVIRSDQIDKNVVVNGIKIKCPEKIKVSLRMETVDRIRKYSSNIDDFINFLLDRFELSSVSMPGISNEMLPVILALSVAKNNRLEYYDALYKIMRGQRVEDHRILSDLIKYKVAYKDEFTNEIKLLAWFEHRLENGKVKGIVAYNSKFCRMFCSSLQSCPLFTDDETKWFGNVFEFDVEEFEKNSVEELVGKCIMRCIPYEEG